MTDEAFEKWFIQKFGESNAIEYAKKLQMRIVWQAAVEAEREACARACYKQGVADEGGWADDVNQTVEACAKAIRARGEK